MEKQNRQIERNGALLGVHVEVSTKKGLTQPALSERPVFVNNPVKCVSRGWLVSEKLKYVEIRPRERSELESALTSNDPNEVCNALYSAAQHEADWRWSQTQCLKMLNHESILVRSAALMALGEIAIFSGHLDLATVLPEIQRFAGDPALGPFVEDFFVSISASKLLQ